MLAAEEVDEILGGIENGGYVRLHFDCLWMVLNLTMGSDSLAACRETCKRERLAAPGIASTPRVDCQSGAVH